MNYIPTITVESKTGYRSTSDIFSKLLAERIVLISGTITEETSALIVSQLLFLESEDSSKDIKLYICDCPGGSISAGMAIYDALELVKEKCDVSTVACGMAASMGAFLFAGGTKGKRLILPNAEVLIHQPLGGAQGQAVDIRLEAEHIICLRQKLNKILAKNTNKSLAQIERDTDRDHWFSAEQAVAYGLADRVLSTK